MNQPTILPSEIWIGGMLFKISRVDSDSVFGAWGMIDLTAPATIKLNVMLDAQLCRESLLHEIIHALDKIGVSFEMSITRALCEKEYPRLEESQVCLFSRLMWLTLTDPRNRQAVDWMLSRV